MLIAQLLTFARMATAAAVKRQTADPAPKYEVTEFTAQHSPNSMGETVQFEISAANVGLETTACGVYGYQCKTDHLLCDIPVGGSCTDRNVQFNFQRDVKTKKWELQIGCQTYVLFLSPFLSLLLYRVPELTVVQSIHALHEQVSVPVPRGHFL